MSMQSIILTVLGVITTSVMSAQISVSDSIDVKANCYNDSLEIQLATYKIETQLTFLMQGLNIQVIQPDTVTMTFPSAPMVRTKVKRHPNEVKASLVSPGSKPQIGLDSINRVIRPDVQPLVKALNDTTAQINFLDSVYATSEFHIDVDRENAVMQFSIKVPINYISQSDGLVFLCIYSCPMSGMDRFEYEGERLSGETAPQPQGLGEGFRKDKMLGKIFCQNVSVEIVKVE